MINNDMKDMWKNPWLNINVTNITNLTILYCLKLYKYIHQPENEISFLNLVKWNNSVFRLNKIW